MAKHEKTSLGFRKELAEHSIYISEDEGGLEVECSCHLKAKGQAGSRRPLMVEFEEK